MEKLYFDLIMAKKWTIEKVPERWREAVAAMVAAAEDGTAGN